MVSIDSVRLYTEMVFAAAVAVVANAAEATDVKVAIK